MTALLVINTTLDEGAEQAIVAGRSPRKDYLELRRALHADMIDLGVLEQRWWTRLLRRFTGATMAQGVLAWALSARYDTVFADREATGFILAILSRFRRRRPRLVMIGHLLSPPKKQLLFRALRLRAAIDCIVVHSVLQQRVAEDDLGLPLDRLPLVPYQADERFWAPQSLPAKHQICSAGLEYRDYSTLVAAVDGLDVGIVIAAASHWSKHRAEADAQLPPNVRFDSLDYEALRRLYAQSLFVVVPLHDVDNQAGITTILEAMAMGKAVVVSHTCGQTDVVRDRRRSNRADSARATQPDWSSHLGADGSVTYGQTGIYVMPGDVDELRRAIVHLLAHPDHAEEMGANGRRLVEMVMGLDDFTARLKAIITGGPATRLADASPLDPVAVEA